MKKKRKLCKECGKLLKESAIICSTCRMKKSRNRHPLKYIYSNAKHNAKRRGKEWLLTYDEFVSFCNVTNYDTLRGRSALALSIDRIRNWEGYKIDNIRAITLADNSRKHDSINVEGFEIDNNVPF